MYPSYSAPVNTRIVVSLYGHYQWGLYLAYLLNTCQPGCQLNRALYFSGLHNLAASVLYRYRTTSVRFYASRVGSMAYKRFPALSKGKGSHDGRCVILFCLLHIPAMSFRTNREGLRVGVRRNLLHHTISNRLFATY